MKLRQAFCLLFVTLLSLLWPLNQAARAQGIGETQAGTGLQTVSQAQGVLVRWQGSVETDLAHENRPRVAGWSTAEIGGMRLPAQLLALRVNSEGGITPRIGRLDSTPWLGTLPSGELVVPQTVDGEKRPGLATQKATKLPDSPVTILRDAHIRGVRIVVVAISAIFQTPTGVRALSNIEVTIPDSQMLGAQESAEMLVASSKPFVTNPPAPVNPLAARPAYKVEVGQAGIQRITGAALAAAGLDLSTLHPSLLHLWHNGKEIPLEDRSLGGQFGVNDELRFYAAALGTRWTATDVDWLTVEATAGLRMSTRSVTPTQAPLRKTALEQGVWRDNKNYDSNLPGADGDHWFAANLRTATGQEPMSLTVTFPAGLPLATGAVTLTVQSSAYTFGQHNLAAQMGNAAQTQTWVGVGDTSQIYTLTDNTPTLVLTLQPGTGFDGVEPDSVAWQRPVSLTFAVPTATFVGLPGTWIYEVNNVPVLAALYDVTDPDLPVVLPLFSGPSVQFQDGPTAHHYVFTRTDGVATPSITANTPNDLSVPLNVDVLYIAPSGFQAALAPLVNLRQSQGYSVRAVDVQSIYDAWSFGQPAPEAIRSFLRYAAGRWSRPPIAVTLVGDGTSDPLNYTGHNNPDLIPPYLAMVDPWIGETACDTCYAQLDGDDPLSDSLPDLMIGRLSVQSADQLADVVSKIVGYESNASWGSWRTQNVFIADNYRDAGGAIIDGAGDFGAASDRVVAMQPSGSSIQRMYYDPSPSHVGVPWREPAAIAAHDKVLALFNQGAGLLNFTGHSSFYQWAQTDLSSPISWLLGQYDPDGMSNGRQLPIVLAMTCLTSAFQNPSFTGTTIDERLLLNPNGGAIAVWGPTGLGLLYGHEHLQQGFYNALWNAPIRRSLSQVNFPVLGRLVAGGYLELYTRGDCCQETLRTYVILGDPLTRARVSAQREVFVPVLQRP